LTDEEKAEFRAQSNRTRPNHRSRKLGDAILRDNYAMMVLINEMILAKKGRPERGRRTAAINYVLGRINEAVDFSTLSKWTKEFESDDEKLEAAHNFFKDRFGGK
jgi:hypothetical protein